VRLVAQLSVYRGSGGRAQIGWESEVKSKKEGFLWFDGYGEGKKWKRGV
jgi:hypothetical protein